MTEEEARDWIGARFGAGAVDRLTCYAAMLATENGRQNLIAPSTVPSLWVRHLLDSAQLADWGAEAGLWLDIGSGGGLPGLVLALLLDRPFVLVEPRRLRAAFLDRAVAELGLSPRVTVHGAKVESVRVTATTISARAVSRIEPLIASARHCATDATIWVLPRGQSGAGEVERIAMAAPATFHVKPSVSDPAAVIVVATGLST